jgi:hypothetical protein
MYTKSKAPPTAAQGSRKPPQLLNHLTKPCIENCQGVALANAVSNFRERPGNPSGGPKERPRGLAACQFCEGGLSSGSRRGAGEALTAVTEATSRCALQACGGKGPRLAESCRPVMFI